MNARARLWTTLIMLMLSVIAVLVGWLVNQLKVEWFIAGFLGALAIGLVFFNYRVGVVCLTVLLPWSWSPLIPQAQGFNVITFLTIASAISLRRAGRRDPRDGRSRAGRGRDGPRSSHSRDTTRAGPGLRALARRAPCQPPAQRALALHRSRGRGPRTAHRELQPASGPPSMYAGDERGRWAIYRGERTHGVTLHWMDAEVDTGAIAYRRPSTSPTTTPG